MGPLRNLANFTAKLLLLLRDVQGTWRTGRTDSVEGAKNKIRGEWQSDAAVTEPLEPWTMGIDRPPQYVSRETEMYNTIRVIRKK